MINMRFRISPVCLFLGVALVSAAADDQVTLKQRLVKTYEAAPITFVENRGQAPEGVDFVANGFGQSILTKASGFDLWVAVANPARDSKTPAARKISANFEQFNKSARAIPQSATENRSGFSIGAKWASNLIGYGKVRYENVWPGASVVYYGNGHELEYDVVLQPGADYKNVKMQFTGVDSLRMNAAGDLVMTAGGREVIQHKPRIYQEIGGQRVEVAGGYRIGRDRHISFEIAKYDRTQELVIDPILAWSKNLTSSGIGLPGLSAGLGIAMDTSGNAYVVGLTPNSFNGVFAALLVKLNASGGLIGSQFLIAGALTGNTLASAVALDSSGNVYVVGQTADTGLTGAGLTGGCNNCGFQPQHAAGSNWDGFLIGIRSTFATNTVNNPKFFGTYMGGTADDFATAVAAFSSNTVYVGGYTKSGDFPHTSGALSGVQNAFLVRVDPTQATGTGSEVWSRYVGGDGTDQGTGVATDQAGNVYLVGTTNSSASSFRPMNSNGFQTVRGGPTDGFLDKIDPTGTTSQYFTFIGNGPASAIAVPATGTGTAYVTGATPGGLTVTSTTAYQTVAGGGTDAYLNRIETNQSGSSSLAYSSYLGGAGNDQGTGVAADGSGKAYVTGFAAAGFPVKNAFQGTFGGGISDIFFAEFDTTQSMSASLVTSSYIGGAANEVGTAIAMNGNALAISGYSADSSGGAIGGLAYGIEGISPLQLVTVTPCRVIDTRNAAGPFGGPLLAANTTRTIFVPSSSCNIPGNAVAYSLNITVVPRSNTLGYLTVYPAGQAQPTVSTLNSLDASTIANAAIVPAGTGGGITAYATDNTDLIIDINGYFVPLNTNGNSLQFYPVTPCRVLDTRGTAGAFGGPALAGGNGRSFPIASSSCLTGITGTPQAYSFNVTVVPHGFLGYVTAWPTGQSQPLVSTLNSFDGTVLANAAIVPAGTSGSVSFYASDTTDLVVDINGYFAAPSASGLNFYSAPPCRVVDTRLSNGSLGSPAMGGGTARSFPLSAGACGLPSSAQAYSLNMTVVPAASILNYLSAWPTGGAQPLVSTLNAFKGQIVANAAIVPDNGGAVSVFVTDTSNVIIDANGYFAH